MLVYPALVPMHSYTDAESGLRTEIDSRKASDHSNIKCPLQKEQGRSAHLLCVNQSNGRVDAGHQSCLRVAIMEQRVLTTAEYHRRWPGPIIMLWIRSKSDDMLFGEER